MTGTAWRQPREEKCTRTNEALALELTERLCTPTKLVVREELALVAMRLNMEFLACDNVRDVAALADAVYHHQPAVIAVVHSAIQEGDPCVHILLELFIRLTYGTSACDSLMDAGVVETLVGVLPMMLTTSPTGAVLLQFLDRVTDDNVASSDRRRRCRLAVQRLCRVACVRALWDVIHRTDRSSSPVVASDLLALSLLSKVTAAISTEWASCRQPASGASAQLVINHTLQRSPQVEKILIELLEDEDEKHGGYKADHRETHVQRTKIVAELLARVQRWRHDNVGLASQKSHCAK